jgi:hypothetical protein
MPYNLAIRTAIAISLGAIPGALSRYYIVELSQDNFRQGFCLLWHLFCKYCRLLYHSLVFYAE